MAPSGTEDAVGRVRGTSATLATADSREPHSGTLPDLRSGLLRRREQHWQELLTRVLPRREGERFLSPALAPAGTARVPGTGDGVAHRSALRQGPGISVPCYVKAKGSREGSKTSCVSHRRVTCRYRREGAFITMTF